MVVDLNENVNNTSCDEVLQELFVDKETKEFLKSKWGTSSDKSRQLKEFKSSSISDEEYMRLKDVFKVLKEETEDYAKYKRAFNSLCKACHIVPDGTIITKYKLTKSKEEDKNTLEVSYSYNTKAITLPAGTKLYHQTVVKGIKELIPRWKLRGKNEGGYLCDKPRVYLTMSKSLPRISTDNKLNTRLYQYEVVTTPTKVFVDPLLPDVFQKAVYVESTTPIPVKPVEKSDVEKVLDKVRVDAKVEAK